jgi:hypothetical protein
MELVATLGVMVVAIVGALTFFDASTRLAENQVNLAELQSTHRLAQQEMVRLLAMSGAGGLADGIDPGLATAESLGNEGVFPNGLAISVMNNVPSGTDLGDSDTPLLVVPGTDVLILRGSFSRSVFIVEPQLDLVLDGAGEIDLVVSASKNLDELGVDLLTGAEDQDVERLQEGTASSRPEAFIVYDRYKPSAFAVLEYVSSSVSVRGDGKNEMDLRLSLGSGAAYHEAYGKMTLGTSLVQGAGGQTWTIPGTTTDVQLPKQIGAVGLIEEYRYFIRQAREVEDQPQSRVTATLTRARYFPGTDDLHPEGAIDLADNIIDLQVALGVETVPKDGQLLEIGDAADDDEVLYNFPGDDDGLAAITSSPWADPDAELVFVRLSTVAQSDRPDRDFPGAVIDLVEDHDYSADTPPSIFNAGSYGKLRKRLLQSVVEVRNLP